MYININFDRIRRHEEYIEEQSILLKSITEDVYLIRNVSQGCISAEYCREILDRLELMRRSINFRQELMVNIVSDFEQIIDRQDEKIGEIDSLLGNLGIED